MDDLRSRRRSRVRADVFLPVDAVALEFVVEGLTGNAEGVQGGLDVALVGGEQTGAKPGVILKAFRELMALRARLRNARAGQ